MTEAVIFDLGWTLVDGMGEVETICRAMVAAGRSNDLQTCLAAMRQQFPDFNNRVDLIPDEAGLAAAYEDMAAKLDFDVPTLMKDYPQSWTLFPEAKQVLAEVRARGYRVGLLSNWGPTGKTVFRQLGLEPFFDDVLFSYECGLVKPAVKIFRLAAERLGLSPADCLMVGDNLQYDIWGALGAGMPAFWVNRRGVNGPEMTRVGANLEPLLEYLPPRREQAGQAG